MDAVRLFPPDPQRSVSIESPLPQLLQTPAGFAILEIQGTIHLPEPTTNTSSEKASPVGKIVIPHYSAQATQDDHSWMKRVYLYVGKHQRLTGEVKKLNKPLAILQKRRQQQLNDEADSEELVVAEIIRYKIIFSQRPEPVGQDAAP